MRRNRRVCLTDEILESERQVSQLAWHDVVRVGTDEWRTTWLQLTPGGPDAQLDPKELQRLSRERAGWSNPAS